MITFEEVGNILDEIAKEIPEDIYKELNGGISLLPYTKTHPISLQAESRNRGDLYIMGEYHNDRKGYGGLGRYITIYYGSFIQVYGNSDIEIQKEELKKILYHEFTHHLESMAGEKDLEIKDAIDLEKYRQKFF